MHFITKMVVAAIVAIVVALFTGVFDKAYEKSAAIVKCTIAHGESVDLVLEIIAEDKKRQRQFEEEMQRMLEEEMQRVEESSQKAKPDDDKYLFLGLPSPPPPRSSLGIHSPRVRDMSSEERAWIAQFEDPFDSLSDEERRERLFYPKLYRFGSERKQVFKNALYFSEECQTIMPDMVSQAVYAVREKPLTQIKDYLRE